MRILLLTELYPGSDDADITGGVEARCWYVARRLGQRHEVQVVARSSDPAHWRPPSLLSVPLRVAGLARMLGRGLRARFDVVEGTNLVTCPLAWVLGRLKRRTVVYWYPDVLIGSWRTGPFGAAGFLGEWFERLVLRLRADGYLAISEATRAKLVAAGVDPSRIRVVHCGFDPDAVSEAAATAGDAPAGTRQVTVVSRLVGYKRVDLAVQAIATLCPDHPDLRLVVVGQGPEQEPLRALAAQLGIADRVVLRGFVPSHVDVLREMARSVVFVSASEIEGFGIVVVEAMALGVPFVISDIDAFREVTHDGTGGLLFHRGSLEDLVAKLRHMLDDDDLRAKSVDAGRALAGRYTWDRIADETEEAYRAFTG